MERVQFADSDSVLLITFAGTPPTIQLSGTSFTTTALGATNTLLPIVILPNALAPGPNPTLSPNVGRLSSLPLVPMRTPVLKRQ